MSGPKKSLHAVQRRLQNGSHGRRHKDMRDEDGEILDPLPVRLPNRHRISRRGCFETDGEEDNFLCRIRARDFQAIDRRINNPHIGSARFQNEQIIPRARHAQHVAETSKK